MATGTSEDKSKKKAKAIVCGSFDILHPGHIHMFKEAKRHAGHLTVVVSRDSNYRAVKQREPRFDENQRLEIISSLSIVDHACLGMEGDKHEIISKIKPDIICLGYDQTAFVEGLDKMDARVIRLSPYKEHKYKSSKLSAMGYDKPAFYE